jgi:class 3 adenylate cyclase
VRSYLLDRSENGFDFCRQAARFFDRIPKQILKVGTESEKLLNEFFGPNCYDVLREPGVPFAWPWQKSFEFRNGGIHAKQIPTISLVMDIRNSSSAMLLTRDAPKFAGFIDRAVEGAREIITNNGGYFDKDTGDGVVGHFECYENPEASNSALRQVLTASKLVSTMTTRLCVDYRENLSIGLRGLGCAVGLFSGMAVWLYSWRGVRAIGGSVVNATRICANANPGEVGYCNTIAQMIKSAEITADIFPLNGVNRQIEISEVREKAIPESTFVQIA